MASDLDRRDRSGTPGGWRHPGAEWTVRWEKELAWARNLGWALLGAVLGGVYSLIVGDWHDGKTWVLLWLSIGLAVVCASIAAWCGSASILRRRMERANGTAYVINEEADTWNKNRAKADKFLAESSRQFGGLVLVPGPRQLDNSWGWALRDDAAARWDARVNELAVAFRALLSGGDRGTPTGIFIWAWWSVAMAFGMRVASQEEGLDLDVWKRPSFSGRTPQEAPVPWKNRPHLFTGPVTGSVRTQEHTWPARLTVSRGAQSPSSETAPARTSAPIAVLLIRVGRQQWGDQDGIPNAEQTSKPEPGRIYEFDVRDFAGVIPDGKSAVTLHELRYDVPIGSVPWHEYPALVKACADWIIGKRAALDGHALLLGMIVPQEVGLGIGIRAAGRAGQTEWPARLWPLMVERRDGRWAFTVPRLNLGTARLDGVS